MAVGRHPLVAHEGRWHIALAVAAAGAVHYYFDWMWALPLWGLAILVTVLFRDPPRTIPADPLGVVCPADGRVVAVEDTRDPYLDRLPMVREKLREAGIPLLLLEGDCNLRSIEQQRTRIEAFIEMLV